MYIVKEVCMRSYSPFSPIVAGLILIAIGRLAQRLMPLLGRMAYQAAAAGSYDPMNYRLPLFGYYLIALTLIVLGVVLAVLQNRRNA
jgi:hypothetical protein